MSLDHPKTAVITLHDYLPSEADQLAGAREWGLPELQNGGDGSLRLDIFFDDVRGVRTTNWPKKLCQRAILLAVYGNALHPHDEVFFINPLCVGFSEKHARDVLKVIHGAGAKVFIYDMGRDLGAAAGREFGPVTDLAPFFAEHKRQLKNAQMRQHRAKAK